MYFQRVSARGALVWKITSMERGSSTAKRLVAASCARGAGARAISSALVRLRTPKSVEKTTSFRRDFFTVGPAAFVSDKNALRLLPRASSAYEPEFSQEKKR